MSEVCRYENRPRLAAEIQQQLDELVEIRCELESGPDFGYAGQIHLESIQAHEQQLRSELAEARAWEMKTTNGHQ